MYEGLSLKALDLQGFVGLEAYNRFVALFGLQGVGFRAQGLKAQYLQVPKPSTFRIAINITTIAATRTKIQTRNKLEWTIKGPLKF